MLRTRGGMFALVHGHYTGSNCAVLAHEEVEEVPVNADPRCTIPSFHLLILRAQGMSHQLTPRSWAPNIYMWTATPAGGTECLSADRGKRMKGRLGEMGSDPGKSRHRVHPNGKPLMKICKRSHLLATLLSLRVAMAAARSSQSIVRQQLTIRIEIEHVVANEVLRVLCLDH
jgi:hypothetical protein